MTGSRASCFMSSWLESGGKTGTQIVFNCFLQSLKAMLWDCIVLNLVCHISGTINFSVDTTLRFVDRASLKI
jgi:hypothetical protein